MCAVSSAQPAPASVASVRPFGVVAAKPCTGLRNSGWCTTSRSAPHVDRLLRDLERRVDGEQHLADALARVAVHQADGVPGVGGRGRVPAVQQVDDVLERGHGAQATGYGGQLTWRSRPSQYGARSLNFCSLPVAVRASSSRNSIDGRRLVAGRLVLAPGDQLGLGHRLALGEHHERLDRLAPLLAGDADHRDLGDRRVGEQHVLDLDRGDVLAAGDDHVLLAVADRQVAVVADHAAVAGVEPAVGQRPRALLGLLPVALEHDVGAGQHLAGVLLVLGDRQPDAERGGAGPGQPGRPAPRRRGRPTRRGSRLKVSSGEVSVRP